MTTQTLSETMLGSPLDDRTVADLLALLDPTAEWEPDDGQADWVSRAIGVDIQGDTDSNEVTSIFFFNEAIEDHNKCSVKLPYGIDIDWNRAQVTGQLGAPSFGGKSHDSWQHEGFRFIVEYDAASRILKASLTKTR